MEELKSMVADLRKQDNPEAVIKSLQKIMEVLLTRYAIKLDDMIVEPLLLEAYCYDWADKQNPPGKNDRTGRFLDDNCHGAPEQKDFMKLYFHKTGYGGVDLCLSDGPYYLSFLIKCACVNKGPICSQTALYDTLCSHSRDVVLVARNPQLDCDHVIYNPRKGLSKPTYQSDLLAAILVDALKYKTVQQSLAKGYSKQWLLAQYAFKQTNYDKNEVSSFLNKNGLYSGNIDKTIIARLE